jgi:hypothetical protein
MGQGYGGDGAGTAGGARVAWDLGDGWARPGARHRHWSRVCARPSWIMNPCASDEIRLHDNSNAFDVSAPLRNARDDLTFVRLP